MNDIEPMRLTADELERACGDALTLGTPPTEPQGQQCGVCGAPPWEACEISEHAIADMHANRTP